MGVPEAAVVRGALEQRLEEVLAAAPSEEAGLFGPDSVTWRVARHTPVYLLSTPLGAFMDAAHPWIAEGVAQHSTLFEDPHRRGQMTYLLLMQIVFGDVATVRRTSRALFGMHSRVQGRLPTEAGRFPAGSAYLANEAHALLWVHLVFFWTRLTVYEQVVGPLTRSDKDRYVEESARFAACFGIPAHLLPATHAELQDLVDRIASSPSIATTPASRRTVEFLMSQLPGPAEHVMTALLVGILHEPLLRALELPTSGRRHRVLHRLTIWGLRVQRVLSPTSAAYLPAYLEARERLGGPAQPRLSKRFSRLVTGRESTFSR